VSRDNAVDDLTQPNTHDDRGSVRDTMTALAAEDDAQQKHRHASRLAAAMANANHDDFPTRLPSTLPESIRSLVHEVAPRKRLRDLVLDRAVRAEVQDFIEEYVQTTLLRSHSLEPRHTALLIGPPGTGKTSLASSVASALRIPLLVVRYDGLVGGPPGETAARIQQVLDYASRFPCIVFFDEFETTGKERDGKSETGDLRRVATSLLLQMLALPSHCVVICATTHPELLDRAVWRRFEMRLALSLPTTNELKEWCLRTERSVGHLGITAQEFVTVLRGESSSEIEAITLDMRRKLVLSSGTVTSAEAFRLALDAWERRHLMAGSF
jgi:SpoVK/Ycf46/Vps4 family AAA+-type ATPase